MNKITWLLIIAMSLLVLMPATVCGEAALPGDAVFTWAARLGWGFCD